MSFDDQLQTSLDQLERERQDRVSQIQRAHAGLSRTRCCDCEEEIPKARQLAVQGVKRCIDCQVIEDRRRG